jgi:hypothetical protein
MATATPAKKRASTAAKSPRRTKAAPAAPAAPAKVAPVATEAAKPAKVKLVRDSFTIPKTEYAAIDELKKRAAKAALPSKKSELIRAGLLALAGMGDASFQAAMSAVPMLKTGRPKKS